jgi:hypothetical protein
MQSERRPISSSVSVKGLRNEQLNVVPVILKRNVKVKLQTNLKAAFRRSWDNSDSLGGASRTDLNHFVSVLERIDFRSC